MGPDKQPRGPGRPPKLKDPRGRILDEAARLFAREGYEAASLNALAEAVGVSKPAIYHYFPSKQHIFDAIIIRTLEGLLTHIRHEVADIRDARAALGGFMHAHADYFEAHVDNFTAMLIGYGGMANQGTLAEAQRLRDDYEALLRAIISCGIDKGEFRALDVATTSRAILSMLNWMVRWFKPGQGRRAIDFAQDYHDLILNGLLAPEGADTRPIQSEE